MEQPNPSHCKSHCPTCHRALMAHLQWLRALCLALLLLRPQAGRVIVDMASRFHKDGAVPLKQISFCVGCPTPEDEGSIVYGLMPKHGIPRYHVTAELIYAIPNHAEKNRLVNGHEVEDRVVLIDRGINNLYEKVLVAQRSGALGVLIADDGTCGEQFDNCGLRAGSVSQGGFAPHDSITVWQSQISIPVLMISRNTANKFRTAMEIKKLLVPPYGWQNISSISLLEDEGEL